MRLLMVSGDRQVVVGEKGPFYAMQREFSRYFERIDVLCPRPDKPPTVHTIHERVHFHPADCARSMMAQWIARRGSELIGEHGARLIVSHDYGWFYNGLGSARLARATGVPYVSEIHHVPGHPIAANWRERFDKRIARAYVRWARDRALAFRVVNAGEMPPLLERWGVPRERIVVLPSLYIDLDVFRPSQLAYTFEQDVVFVGRMVGNKGLDRIVDALAKLATRKTPLRALFVGNGPYLAATRARVLARKLGDRVRFIEWVERASDLAEIYRQSRVCVCASSCEGGPRFTVEAMACGTPVVSTPVGVMSEIVRDGENGRLVGFDVAEPGRGLRERARRRRSPASARRKSPPRRAAFRVRAHDPRLRRGLVALGGRARAGGERAALRGLRALKLLFLTQVIDAQDAVLGFVPRWIEGLARHCERVRVVALEAGDIAGLPKNVDVRVVGRKGTFGRWLRYRSILTEALHDDGFDTVLAHMVPRYALVAAGPAKKSGARLFLWYTHAGVDARLLRAERVVERIFTASPESLRVDTRKRVVTGHGIDLDHFDHREEAPARPARLLAVGRLTPAKDPLTILAAMSILVARGFDLHLDLVGGGLTAQDESYMRSIREQVEVGDLASRVHFAGSVPYRDVPMFYRRASVVINSSRTGSVDKVVLEAMAAARPFVSCNAAIPPLVAELGRDAERLHFAPQNASELAQRVQALLAIDQAERDALGQRLRAIVARDHEVEALMERLFVEMGGVL